MNTCLIAIDVGTTAVKGLAVDRAGLVLHKQEARLASHFPIAGHAEQHSGEIWQAVSAVLDALLAQVSPQACEGLVLSTAMHALMAVAADGTPLSPFLLWSDSRAADIADIWKAAADYPTHFEATGVPMHPMLPVCKIEWLRHFEPKIYEKAAFYIDLKAFLTHKLCGWYYTDISSAAATGLYDLHTQQWYPPRLEACGISAGQLPGIALPYQLACLRKPEHAHIPLVIGASDGCLANLGSGVLRAGLASVTMGTSGAVRATIEGIRTDPQRASFCYPVDHQLSVVGGGLNSGSIVLEWASQHLFGGQYDFEAFERLAGSVPAGAAGLRFKPYLLGERAPIWDAKARGGFEGLQLQHQTAHLARAVWEGLTLNLVAVLQLVDSIQPVQQIHASGGMARSDFWLQLLADISGRPVLRSSDHDASAYGAARYAMRALGWIADYAAFVEENTRFFEPNAAVRTVYDAVLAE